MVTRLIGTEREVKAIDHCASVPLASFCLPLLKSALLRLIVESKMMMMMVMMIMKKMIN